MKERDINSVEHIENTDWDNDTGCFTASDDLTRDCNRSASKVIGLTYENELGKTFYTVLCEQCAEKYLRKWDKAQIFG